MERKKKLDKFVECEIPGTDGQEEDEKVSNSFEKKYVYEVYDKISKGFDVSRAYMWKPVQQFIDEEAKHCGILCDVGCGNGKYIEYAAKQCEVVGTDISSQLLIISRENTRGDLFRCDSLVLPVKTGVCGAVLSVAVLHHFSTKKHRRQAVRELLRIVRQGGKVLVTVWMRNGATSGDKSDVLVRFSLENIKECVNDEDVYNNHRYYHMYDQSDVDLLVDDTKDIAKVDSITHDNNNYIIVLRKL